MQLLKCEANITKQGYLAFKVTTQKETVLITPKHPINLNTKVHKSQEGVWTKSGAETNHQPGVGTSTANFTNQTAVWENTERHNRTPQ